MTSTAPAAARAYRELLRVQRALFAGDLQARIAARIETRDQFLAHANAKPEEVWQLLVRNRGTGGLLPLLKRKGLARSLDAEGALLGAGAPDLAAYKTHSASIVDVLKVLKGTAEAKLSDLRKA